MRDGLTRKMVADTVEGSSFLHRNEVSIVLITGPEAGAEFTLDQATVTLGRGPGVDLTFDNELLSRQHVAFDLVDQGYRLRDMGSTNGVAVDGEKVESHELVHGDKFSVGKLVFQYVVQEKPLF